MRKKDAAGAPVLISTAIKLVELLAKEKTVARLFHILASFG